ncbi:MAG: cytidylate kinase-like family protein [Magnetococcales bacterium]|nr:cytidylate kinase-like family protein [Magnetococcales bacterium]
MSKKGAQDIIQSIIGAEAYTEGHGPDGGVMRPPVITVSRYFGAGGTEISRLLAERLGVRLFDRDLLKEVIKEAKGDKFLLEKMDERVTTLMDDLMHTFFSDKGASKDDFFHYLARVVLGITQTGGVVVGRGAHLLVPKGVFRIRLEGSLAVCTKRVAKNMDIKRVRAERLIVRTNKERASFVEKLAKRFPPDGSEFDLTINTDIFTQDQVVDLILHAMREASLLPPADKGPKKA